MLVPEFMKKILHRWSLALGRVVTHHAYLVLALLVTTAGIICFAFTGIGGNRSTGFAFLQNIELRSLDARFALRGQRERDDRIVIVGMDDRTLQNAGSFPIPRKFYAQLINRLHQSGAAVVGFDETFPTPEFNSAQQPLTDLQHEFGGQFSAAAARRIESMKVASDQDAQFAAALKQSGNVVLGHIFLDRERARSSDPKLEEAYFNIVWAKAFPQVLKVHSKTGSDFDLGTAWIERGGTVAAGAEANITKLAEAAASYGFLDINPDPDGTLRHALLMIRYKDQDFFPSLAMQCVREFEKIPDQQMAAYISENGLERIQLGQHELRQSRDGSALINYTGPYGSYPHYSLWEVVQGRVPAEDFRGKIVLVGATAVGIGDIRNTPYQGGAAYMGVEVHANIIDNLLHSNERGRTFLSRGIREEALDAGFILLFGLVCGVLFGRLRPMFSTLSLLLALGGFAAVVYFSFAQWGLWLSAVVPAGTLVANYAAITSFRVIFEEREKRKIRKTFSQYLSPGVIAIIEKDPLKYIRPGGEQKELTVMFSDIRGFTSIAEGLTPDALVHLLNEFLGEMTEVLFQHLGTLDKYIGDAIMAFWGSPYPQDDHALRGCRCALQMQQSLTQLNAKWRAEGRQQIAIGIGLNTGVANVGNMGSARRLAWTVMGDSVNLASRLEGLTRMYEVPVVISEGTYAVVRDEFVCRELDKIRVKGRHLPVTIYELKAVGAERVQHQEMLRVYEHALESYRLRDWPEAILRLDAVLAAYPEDGPSLILRHRALEFVATPPPAEWDGVYEFKSK